MINLHKIFISCSGRNINSKSFNKIRQLIKYSLPVVRNADVIMCHGYKLASLNFGAVSCYLALMVENLVH